MTKRGLIFVAMIVTLCLCTACAGNGMGTEKQETAEAMTARLLGETGYLKDKTGEYFYFLYASDVDIRGLGKASDVKGLGETRAVITFERRMEDFRAERTEYAYTDKGQWYKSIAMGKCAFLMAPWDGCIIGESTTYDERNPNWSLAGSNEVAGLAQLLLSVQNLQAGNKSVLLQTGKRRKSYAFVGPPGAVVPTDLMKKMVSGLGLMQSVEDAETARRLLDQAWSQQGSAIVLKGFPNLASQLLQWR